MEMKVPPYKIPPLSDFKVTKTIRKKDNEIPYQYQFILQQHTTGKST